MRQSYFGEYLHHEFPSLNARASFLEGFIGRGEEFLLMCREIFIEVQDLGWHAELCESRTK